MGIDVENISLPKFEKEKYLEHGKKTYEMREEVEKIADEVFAKGAKNIVLIGIGGTEFEMMAINYILKKYSTIDTSLYNAADANTLHPRKITKDTLVITASASGDTKEIIEATHWIKETGAYVVAFTKKEGKLGKLVDVAIESPGERLDQSYLLFNFFILKYLNNRGEFPEYTKFADQMKDIFIKMLPSKVAFDPTAEKLAKEYCKAPYTIFTGSGAAWGETMMFAMCILEEMQWVRTRPVTSAQFFHGTLELVEKGIPVVIVKGEDEYRVQDERVENFCKLIGHEDVIVVDLASFEVEGVDKEFRPLISPMLLTGLLTNRAASYYETYTKHNLDYRRYYRQFGY